MSRVDMGLVQRLAGLIVRQPKVDVRRRAIEEREKQHGKAFGQALRAEVQRLWDVRPKGGHGPELG